MKVVQSFLNFVLEGGNWSLHGPASGVHSETCWLTSRVSLNIWQKRNFLAPAENRKTVPRLPRSVARFPLVRLKAVDYWTSTE